MKPNHVKGSGSHLQSQNVRLDKNYGTCMYAEVNTMYM